MATEEEKLFSQIVFQLVRPEWYRKSTRSVASRTQRSFGVKCIVSFRFLPSWFPLFSLLFLPERR